MGEIKKFSIGIVTFIFEAKGFIYEEPPEEFGLTKMVQVCYIAEPGSIVFYSTEDHTMHVCEKGFWFPEVDCRNPSDKELAEYERLNLI